ncbi:MAG: hypothetical protein HYU43_08275 [Armatimonadetes bacterium]|nr:hypothetical protein [Armatimonadota bacterium]
MPNPSVAGLRKIGMRVDGHWETRMSPEFTVRNKSRTQFNEVGVALEAADAKVVKTRSQLEADIAGRDALETEYKDILVSYAPAVQNEKGKDSPEFAVAPHISDLEIHHAASDSSDSEGAGTLPEKKV